jgi:hypothetical protein
MLAVAKSSIRRYIIETVEAIVQLPTTCFTMQGYHIFGY